MLVKFCNFKIYISLSFNARVCFFRTITVKRNVNLHNIKADEKVCNFFIMKMGK